MDIYELLKKDHQTLQQMMEDLEEMDQESNKEINRLFNQIKVEFLVHAKAEEKVFYDALMDFDETKDKAEHSEEEHREVESLAEKLTDSSLSGDEWLETFAKFKQEVMHHINEEENQLFEKAKKVLDDDQAEAMAEAMEDQKEKEKNKQDIEFRRESA